MKTLPNLKIRRGRPREKENWNANLLNDRAREYFMKCDSRTKEATSSDGVIELSNPAPYTVQGLCNYLDITVQTFRNWRHGKGVTENIAKKAAMLHQKITENRVAGALDGKQNSAFAKFLLTNENPDEYREKVELESEIRMEVRSILELCSGMKIKEEQDE